MYALFFNKKRSMYSILSCGINNCRAQNSGMYGSIHAEMDAVKKLPYRAKNKKTKKVDLLVVKSSKTHCLSMSRPCIKCIYDLIIEPVRLGYKINRIYFSNKDGEIECRTLSSLAKDKEQHITRAYSKINITFP